MVSTAQLTQLLAGALPGVADADDASGDVAEMVIGRDASAISLVLALIVVLGFLLTWLRDRRSIRVEKSAAYLQLETQSSEAFRYAAGHGQEMKPFEPRVAPKPRLNRESKGAEITRQYYFQCLNLFEVCSNFRRKGVIEKEVYASWVAWFHELLDQWYFRELWQAEMRDNYTPDVRAIFDLGVAIYAQHAKAGEDDLRKREFYKAVSHLLGGCSVIDTWLDRLDEVPEWPPAVHGKPVMVRRDAR
jgi:hypothetical protein